jgi:hypothetical protein
MGIHLLRSFVLIQKNQKIKSRLKPFGENFSATFTRKECTLEHTNDKRFSVMVTLRNFLSPHFANRAGILTKSNDSLKNSVFLSEYDVGKLSHQRRYFRFFSKVKKMHKKSYSFHMNSFNILMADRDQPQIRIAVMIDKRTTVMIVPTAAVELSKKLSDIRRCFYGCSKVGK